MFVVKRCVQDYEDIFKWVIAEFETEQDADNFANEQDVSWDVWFEVSEA